MFLTTMTEPAIIIITTAFLFFTISILTSYNKTEKNLKLVYSFLSEMNKKELSYRYNQLNDFMSNNTYTRVCWEDLKKALIFPEKLYTTSQSASEIFLTIDSSYFFNEESLVYSKINYKFIQAMPTLLTGLGPFFTFLKMAIIFSSLSFTSANVENTMSTLMQGIQIAALCSVFAVGYSLLFLLIEKILYNKKCKKYCLLIQKELIRLFDICTSEQFLLDLVKESRIQNSSSEKALKSLPENLANSIAKSLGELTTPYLENILYSLNRLNENLDKNSGDDMVDKLF